MKKITEYMASSTTVVGSVRSRRLSTSGFPVAVSTDRTLSLKVKSSKISTNDSDSANAEDAATIEDSSGKSEVHHRPAKRRRIEPSSPTTSTPTTKKARTLSNADGEAEVATGCVVGVKASLESLERDTMGASWHDALQPEFEKGYFRKLKSYLKTEVGAGTVYPALHDIYSWSRLTPLNDVRVVIIGQDPYHDVNQAHGLAFSVLPPTKAPPSLKNIFKQIKTEYPSFVVPSTGDLTPLAQRGVLFLNTCLTVRAHKAHSHAKRGWEELTTAALRAIAQRDSDTHKGVVFMAWGLPAQKTCAAVGIDEKRHLLLKSAHPSPLSAYRGFFGNGHFKRANDWLEERYGEGGGVDWTALSRAS